MSTKNSSIPFISPTAPSQWNSTDPVPVNNPQQLTAGIQNATPSTTAPTTPSLASEPSGLADLPTEAATHTYEQLTTGLQSATPSTSPPSITDPSDTSAVSRNESNQPTTQTSNSSKTNYTLETFNS